MVLTLYLVLFKKYQFQLTVHCMGPSYNSACWVEKYLVRFEQKNMPRNQNVAMLLKCKKKRKSWPWSCSYLTTRLALSYSHYTVHMLKHHAYVMRLLFCSKVFMLCRKSAFRFYIFYLKKFFLSFIQCLGETIKFFILKSTK